MVVGNHPYTPDKKQYVGVDAYIDPSKKQILNTKQTLSVGDVHPKILRIYDVPKYPKMLRILTAPKSELYSVIYLLEFGSIKLIGSIHSPLRLTAK